MKTVVIVSVVLGISCGAFLGTRLGVLAMRAVGRRFEVPSKLLLACATAFGAVALVPSFFLSIVAGGTVGGSWADYLVGAGGVPIGLGFGVCLVFAFGLAAAGALGSLLAAAITCVRRRPHAA
jgi:hypothetical protein